MRDFYLLAFILALPALAVLGHDIYIAYNNTHLDVAERFFFSDLGWLWTEYSPATYDAAMESTDAEIWNNIIDPLLQKSAFYVAIAPFGAFLAIMLLLKIIGIGPFKESGLFRKRVGKKKGFSHSADKDKGRTKYKRK